MPSGRKLTSNSVHRSQAPSSSRRPSARRRSYSGVPGNGVMTVIWTSNWPLSRTNSLDRLEDLRPVAVEAQDEAAVDGDAVRLDPLDGRLVVVEARPLPVPALLDARRCRSALGLSRPMSTSAQPDGRISSSSSGSSAMAMSVSVNQRTRSGASARRSSLEWRRSTNVLSSANSMNGFGQWRLISWISASTFATGLTLYLGVRRMDAAQNSQRHGQPRWVCTVSRL